MFDSEYDKFKAIFDKDGFFFTLKGIKYKLFANFSSHTMKLDKPDIFWHISSLEPKKECSKTSSIQPCVNVLRENDCVADSADATIRNALLEKGRVACVFRALCSENISKLKRDLVSGNITDLKVWYSEEDGEIHVSFRKYYSGIDFIAVAKQLKKKDDYIPLMLITAYPLEYKEFKECCDKKWRKHPLI